MRILLLVSMAACLVLGCAEIIPEEWIPLVGEWDLLQSTEYDTPGGTFVFSSYGEINFDNLECYGLYGERGGFWSNRYFCTLTEDNAEAEFRPDQYKYYAAVYAYPIEYPEDLFEVDYYFNMVDESSIEGVYVYVPFSVPPLPIVLTYMPFSGTKKES